MQKSVAILYISSSQVENAITNNIYKKLKSPKIHLREVVQNIFVVESYKMLQERHK